LVLVNASINTCVGGDAMVAKPSPTKRIRAFLAFFASTPLHGCHSAQIERHAHELELGLRLL
jgi:hypothetical protein